MFALLRRYLRRVDALYLALCAACSAVSVVVLVSIGQTQLGSNNKASVQLIASFLGIMLAVIFSTAPGRCMPRWRGDWCCPPCFCTTSGRGSSPSGTMRAEPPITAGIGWAA